MIRAQLFGTVWASQCSPLLEGRKLVLAAETENGKRSGRVVVAIDTLGSSCGDDVVIAFGSGARNALSADNEQPILADAAVVQRVEGSTCS
ncbi:MAG TPA: ethanolamine utilization protein EutN [Myxococcales bacterium]|nr:ethanolamine utilization protein EutN [Myxococcales bacterium]HIN85323.1 ethanolamine utilization protein EutN [Myxococcales bacterium]